MRLKLFAIFGVFRGHCVIDKELHEAVSDLGSALLAGLRDQLACTRLVDRCLLEQRELWEAVLVEIWHQTVSCATNKRIFASLFQSCDHLLFGCAPINDLVKDRHTLLFLSLCLLQLHKVVLVDVAGWNNDIVSWFAAVTRFKRVTDWEYSFFCFWRVLLRTNKGAWLPLIVSQMGSEVRIYTTLDFAWRKLVSWLAGAGHYLWQPEVLFSGKSLFFSLFGLRWDKLQVFHAFSVLFLILKNTVLWVQTQIVCLL